MVVDDLVKSDEYLSSLGPQTNPISAEEVLCAVYDEVN
jgi:hypothetical protein